MPPTVKSARDLVAQSGLAAPAAEPGALVPMGSSGSLGEETSIEPKTSQKTPVKKEKVSGKDILFPAYAYYLIYLIGIMCKSN